MTAWLDVLALLAVLLSWRCRATFINLLSKEKLVSPMSGWQWA